MHIKIRTRSGRVYEGDKSQFSDMGEYITFRPHIFSNETIEISRLSIESIEHKPNISSFISPTFLVIFAAIPILIMFDILKS